MTGIVLRNRNESHLSRKIFHIFNGTLLFALYAWVFSEYWSIALFTGATFVLITLDYLRLRYPNLNRWSAQYLGAIMRENESLEMSAQTHFVLGVLFAICFFPKPVAIQMILTLAWMDPAAGIVGVNYGRRTWNSLFSDFFLEFPKIPRALGAKTIEGSLAGLVAALAAGVVAWFGPWAEMAVGEGVFVHPETWQKVVLCVSGSVAAIIAEVWPTQWDDNAIVPFWTGLVVLATAVIIGAPVLN